MPAPTTYQYLPLLEGQSGKVYLSNAASPTVGSGITYPSYNSATVNVNSIVDNGVLGISPSSDSLWQGRLSLAYNSGTSRYELDYNGGNWTSTSPDRSLMVMSLSDIAWYKDNGATKAIDKFPVTSHSDIINGTVLFNGGIQSNFYIHPLSVPQIASITPSTIPADGQPHNVTLTLQRRLHSKQSPTVSISISGITVSVGTIVAVKNGAGQTTGWTVPITANAQPSATGSILFTASETLEYLKVDQITTELVQYATNVNIGSFGVQQQIVAVPLTVSSVNLELPSGIYGSSTDGWLKPLSMSNLTAGFAGKLLFKITLYSGTDSLSYSSVTVVTKPTGQTTRTTLAFATPVGPSRVGTNPQTGFGTVYFQDFAVLLDTTTLSAYQLWDIGFVAEDSTASITNWLGTYVNANLTPAFGSYTVFVDLLTSGATYTWNGNAWDTTPTLKGSVVLSISENWNFLNYLKQNSITDPLADNTFEPIDHYELVVDGVLAQSKVAFGSSSNRLTKITDQTRLTLPFTIDTTALTTGNHTFQINLISKVTGQSMSLQYPLGVNQSAGSGGGGGCFTEDTYVYTVDGPQLFKNLRKDQFVVSLPENSHLDKNFKYSVGKISEIIVHNNIENPFNILTVDGIKTTQEHRWAVPSGFSRTDVLKDLQEPVLIFNGHETLYVLPLLGTADSVTTVYNLEVPSLKTYMVAANPEGPWHIVHNVKYQFG